MQLEASFLNIFIDFLWSERFSPPSRLNSSTLIVSYGDLTSGVVGRRHRSCVWHLLGDLFPPYHAVNKRAMERLKSIFIRSLKYEKNVCGLEQSIKKVTDPDESFWKLSSVQNIKFSSEQAKLQTEFLLKWFVRWLSQTNTKIFATSLSRLWDLHSLLGNAAFFFQYQIGGIWNLAIVVIRADMSNYQGDGCLGFLECLHSSCVGNVF